MSMNSKLLKSFASLISTLLMQPSHEAWLRERLHAANQIYLSESDPHDFVSVQQSKRSRMTHFETFRSVASEPKEFQSLLILPPWKNVNLKDFNWNLNFEFQCQDFTATKTPPPPTCIQHTGTVPTVDLHPSSLHTVVIWSEEHKMTSWRFKEETKDFIR